MSLALVFTMVNGCAQLPDDFYEEFAYEIRALKSSDGGERAVGARYLGRAGAKARPFIPLLVRMLADEELITDYDPIGYPHSRSYPVASVAADALVDIGAPSVAALIQAARSENPGVRFYAMHALALINEPQATSTLLRGLKDDSRDVRYTVASSIHCSDPMLAEGCIYAVRDRDDGVREQIIERIGESRSTRFVPTLLAAMRAESLDERQSVVRALYRIESRAARAALVAVAKDVRQSVDVRRSAAFALVKMREPTAFEPLMSLARDANSELQLTSIRALGELGNPRALPQLTATLQSGVLDQRLAATEALGTLGDAGAVPSLIAALDAPELEIRVAAAESLGSLADARAVLPLLGALAATQPEERKAAATALGKIADERALAPLRKLSEDPSSGVADAARFSVYRIENKAMFQRTDD